MDNYAAGSSGVARFRFVLETEQNDRPAKDYGTSGVGGVNDAVLELRWKCETLTMLVLLGFGAAALFAFLWVGKTFLW